MLKNENEVTLIQRVPVEFLLDNGNLLIVENVRFSQRRLVLEFHSPLSKAQLSKVVSVGVNDKKFAVDSLEMGKDNLVKIGLLREFD